MKIKIAEQNKGGKWTMKDLDRALADLKNDKCRDFEGYINKMFKEGVIGLNLRNSLLTMLNGPRDSIITKFL